MSILLMAFLGPVQNWLLYYPIRYDRSVVASLSAKAGLEAWPSPKAYRGFIAGGSGEAPGGTLAVFPGNAGSAVNRVYYRDLLAPFGIRVILLEYPGYGAREGKPGEAVLVADGAESLRMILERYGRPIYVLGESLGAAVATGAIAGSGIDIDGLILCTPWDDLASVARVLYWFLPVNGLIQDRYDSTTYLKSYDGPLAVIVAERDELIPRQSSDRIFEAYHGPKQIWVVPGTHNTWLGFTDRPWWRSIFQFLRQAS